MWRSWQRWANHRGLSLADLSIAEGKLTLHVRGADKLWAFKSSLEIPLIHIAGVRADPEIARGWYHGIRSPGTNVPGVITAGTFYQDGKRVFWDVHHPEKTIVIDLHDEQFSQLVVEVADPVVHVGFRHQIQQGFFARWVSPDGFDVSYDAA